MRYFSTFSGIGGFELGIQQAYDKLCIKNKKQGIQRIRDTKRQSSKCPNIYTDGFTCIGYSEINKYAIQIYEKCFGYRGVTKECSKDEKCQSCINRGDGERWRTHTYRDKIKGHKNYGDITKIRAKELPNFDILVGGFPCQAFSIAGKRKGFSDTRGTLFFDLARIIKEKQPRLLLFENVKGLLSHDKGRTFFTIISTLDELGYDLQWQVLNSKNFGVPQNRERVFIIGHLRGTSRPEVFPIRENDKPFDEKSKRETQTTHPIRAGYKAGQGGNDYIQTSTTINKIRRLTPTECERLQGFPDKWTEELSDTQRYKCLGNAVTVNVIKAIMECIKDCKSEFNQ